MRKLIHRFRGRSGNPEALPEASEPRPRPLRPDLLRELRLDRRPKDLDGREV